MAVLPFRSGLGGSISVHKLDFQLSSTKYISSSISSARFRYEGCLKNYINRRWNNPSVHFGALNHKAYDRT